MTDERFEPEDEAQVLARYRKLPKPQPSAALDAAILAQARAAVANPATVPRVERRRSRWPAVFATAATLALAVGVSWQIRQAEQARQPVLEGVPVPQSSGDEIAQPAADAAPAAGVAAPAVAKQQRTDPSGKLESITVTGTRIQRTEVETAAGRARPAEAGSANAAVDAKAADSANEATAQRPAGDTSRERRAAGPEPEPSPVIVFDEALPMAEPAPPPAEPERKADDAQLIEEQAAPPAAPPPPPAPAMSAPAPPTEAAPQPFEDAERDQPLMRKESAPADAARNALGATSAQPAPSNADAERELDRIERLIQRRRFDAARRALATFRRDHPDYPVPRAITDALD